MLIQAEAMVGSQSQDLQSAWTLFAFQNPEKQTSN